jgi:hypothetical protein
MHDVCASLQQVFSSELRLYEAEGIDVVVSSCPDNSECIELLSGRLVSKTLCITKLYNVVERVLLHCSVLHSYVRQQLLVIVN